MVLADLGADVVKIVRPGEAVVADGPLTMAQAFEWATNRDKRALQLDLRGDGDRDTFLELVSQADVVFDNFRPGTLDRLGLGYDRLREANPQIITCDISGFGSSGPWAQMPSYDPIAQAASGSIDITGPHGDPRVPPCRWGVPIGDIAASLYAVIGILAALAVRDRDGIGQRVGVSMLDCLLALSTYRAPQAFDAGLSARMDPHKGGAGTTPYGPYRCDDGRWIAIGFAQPHWKAACEAMDSPGADHGSPLRDRGDAQSLRRGARRLSWRRSCAAGRASEWEELFIAAGAPAGKVNNLKRPSPTLRSRPAG